MQIKQWSSLTALGCASLLVPATQAQFAAPTALPAIDEALLTVDLDGDGDQDIVGSNLLSTTSAAYVWIENQGAGNFSIVRPIQAAGTGYQPMDVDGDGDLDMARVRPSSQSSGMEVQWIENTGGAAFSAPVPYGALPPVNNVNGRYELADMDGDGDADVVALDWFNDRVVVTENVGGNFAPYVAVGATALFPRGLAVGDIDADGDIDILWIADVSVHFDDYEVFGVLQNQGGNFQFATVGAVQNPSGYLYYGLSFKDVDGDGDLDVVEGSLDALGDVQSPSQQWFENLGGGWLRRVTDWGVTSGRLVDVDADGDQDHLAVDQFSVGEIRWREMSPGATGLLPQRSAKILGVLASPSFHRSFDGDGDGDLDLIMSTPNGAFFYVENRLNGDIGALECGPAVQNSTGQPATIAGDGSLFIERNEVTLNVTGLPLNATGIFATSRQPFFLANPGGSQGNVCLGAPVGLYVGPGQIQNSGPAGAIALTLDLTAIPTPLGPVSAIAGETWRFQAWYRDANPNTTSNFTPALALQVR